MSPAPSSYHQSVAALFADLLPRFDAVDPDLLEAEAAEGVIKLTFADGSKCILNRQSAAEQVWLAHGATAWHFVYDAAQLAWMDTKGRGELRAILGDIVQQQLGRRIDLG